MAQNILSDIFLVETVIYFKLLYTSAILISYKKI
jgi:hypothetical protein